MANAQAPYSVEVKAQCLSMLLEGQSLMSVVAKTGVSRRTLLNWKADTRLGPTATEPQRQEIGHLVVESLRTGLDAMQAIQEVFTDPVYLRKFSPPELSTAFGIIADKSLRVLEAMITDDESSDG